MGEEWIEIAALWKPRNENSRLVAKGAVITEVKKGEKILIMKNDYATEENRQPQFRVMVIRENPNIPIEENICLKCGENLSLEELENGDSYHSVCHDLIRLELEEDKEEESRLNPYGMG
jgi:hypothetical protein